MHFTKSSSFFQTPIFRPFEKAAGSCFTTLHILADKKKLFLIINRLVIGGPSVDAVSLAHHLSSKYDVTIVYGEKETEEVEVLFSARNYPHLSFLKIPSLHRSILPVTDVITYRKLLSLFKKQQPDIVHTHGFKTGFLGRLAARKAKVPVIIHTYHGHLFHSYYNRFLSSFVIGVERWLTSFSTRIIAISPQQAYELSHVYRIAPAQKISTIFLGIDKENYQPSSQASVVSLRQQYSIPDDAVIVAIISRLVMIKNHSLFINIAETILREQQNIYFFIIGDGNEKKLIQNEMNKYGMDWQEGEVKNKPAHIIFTSWITDIGAVLPGIDIVVLTSLNEGTPVSLIEAQLFEKPVIATNVGGVKDTMINHETGFLVDDFNVDEFVKRIRLLAKDKDLRERMGKAGMAFAAERFSKEKEVAAIDDLYTTCLQQQKNKE